MFLFISEPSGRLHNQGELRAPRDPHLVMSKSDLDAQAQSHESVGAGTFFTTYEERISLKSVYRESRCATFTISTESRKIGFLSEIGIIRFCKIRFYISVLFSAV